MISFTFKTITKHVNLPDIVMPTKHLPHKWQGFHIF